MFKIAFIGQKGIPVIQGGVERHVEELAVRLARNGHEVSVYTRPQWVPKEYKKYEQVKLVSLPSIKSKHLDAISHTFFSILHAVKNDVEIIHFQGVGPSLLAWLPKILNRKIKVVATVHSPDWEHQKWNWLARQMLKLGARFACLFADEIISVSRGLQKYCLSKHNSEAVYIPNGVGLLAKNKPASEDQNKILEAYNLKSNKYLLVVTRLVKHKGIHYLIEAFKNIKDIYDVEKNFEDFKLVIVGATAFTEDYEKYLLKLVKDRNDIVFTGAQNGLNLDALYRHGYLYVQPSESEGLSISVLEAMAYGKSVLVSNIEENLELIAGNSETGTVGFDFQNKSVADLTKKLLLLMNEPDLVHQVGKKAKNYVKLYYNWEEIVDRTERVYKNVVLVKDKISKSIIDVISIRQQAERNPVGNR